jgi:hypothetical protein
MAKKKVTKRYLKQQKEFSPISKKDYNDYDYIDLLSDKEREFLYKFNSEFYSGRFQKDKETNEYIDPLHTTHDSRLDCYGNNNSSNRDIYPYVKYNKMLDQFITDNDLDGLVHTSLIGSSYEDNLHMLMDLFKQNRITKEEYDTLVEMLQYMS